MGTKSSPGSETASVSCPCGASLNIDPSQASQEAACPDCGQLLEVVVTTDPGTKKRRVGILVKAASVAPRLSKPKAAAPGGKAEEIHTAKCTCGAQLTIVPKSPDTIYTCPACDAEFTATLKPGRTGAMSTLVLRAVVAMPLSEKPPGKAPAEAPAEAVIPAPARPAPVKAEGKPPAPASKPAKASPAPAAKPERASRPAPGPSIAQATPAKENLLLTARGDISAQEVLARETGQAIFCTCGREIALKQDYHREVMKCRECGLSFRIFAAVHPKTGRAMAILLPRDMGSPKGKGG